MKAISKEFQASIEKRIEMAFTIGTGDYFMQKDDFFQVIAVSAYDIEEKENKGFELFSLAYYNRSAKQEYTPTPAPTPTPKMVEMVDNSYSISIYDDYPEFYGHCGL